MKKIGLVAYIAIATLFCVQDATALIAENNLTCMFDDMGSSYTGSISNSLSSGCATRHYYRLRNTQTGVTYGVWQECEKCNSSYYLSDTQSNMWHNTCGKIYFYGTCETKKTCSPSVSVVSSSSITGCASASKITFGGSTVYSCNTCNSGYTKTSETVSDQQCTNTTTRYYCSAPACTAVTVSTYSTPTMTGCKTQYKKSFGGQVYDTCGECQTGYYLDNPNAKTISSTQCSNTVKSIGCIKSCTGDGTTGWACMGNWCTWRHRVVANGQCQGENYFTCAEGYYGKAPSGCIKCPENPGGSTPRVLPSYEAYPWALNSYKGHAIDNTTIDDCSVTSGKDASGEYEFVNGSSSVYCGYTYSN